MSIYEIKGNIQLNKNKEFNRETFCTFAESIDDRVIACNKECGCEWMGKPVELYIHEKHLKLNPCYFYNKNSK